MAAFFISITDTGVFFPRRSACPKGEHLYQKTEDIAADMDINAATVRTKLARGRKRLRAYLTERGYSVESIYD